MRFLPRHFRLFLMFSVLCSCVLIPSAWILYENSTPIEKSDWASQHAWTLHNLQKNVSNQQVGEIKVLLLNHASTMAGQLRWVGAEKQVLLSTKQGANPHNYDTWPSIDTFHQWLLQPIKFVLPGWPSQVDSYLQTQDSQPNYVILKTVLNGSEQIRGQLLYRLQIPAQLKAPWAQSLRNGLAIALSLGFLISLLAIIGLIRPQKKLEDYIMDLQQGDLGAALPHNLQGLESLGDVIADLAVNIRQRVGVAYEASAVLQQFTDALPLAVVVWNWEGKMESANGLARRLFGFHHPEGEDQVANLLSNPEIRAKIHQAEEESEPAAVVLDLRLPQKTQVKGFVHVLKRPKEKALVVFVSYDFLAIPPRYLTSDDRVVPQKFYKLWRRVFRLAKPLLKRTQNEIILPDVLPEEMVAEVQDRLYWSLAIVLVTFAATKSGEEIAVETQIFPYAVQLRFSSSLEKRINRLLQLILEPVGGRIEMDNEEVILWLPRA
jgi:PAS domain-containing protein